MTSGVSNISVATKVNSYFPTYARFGLPLMYPEAVLGEIENWS